MKGAWKSDDQIRDEQIILSQLLSHTSSGRTCHRDIFSAFRHLFLFLTMGIFVLAALLVWSLPETKAELEHFTREVCAELA